MIASVDDRRTAFFDIFTDATPGQVNIVRLRRGVICGWHRHQKQTDHYFCVSGVVKVGMMTESEEGGAVFFGVLDAHHPIPLAIAPDTWHGYTALTEEAVLLQYLDRKFDASDEERKSVAEMGVDWGVQSR